jgi:dTMP kinase
VVTREPGGTAIAEKVRSILLAPEHREMLDRCEVLLYLACRAQHVGERIAPALAGGAIVLCDRFALATYAYQGFGRGIDLPNLVALNDFATGGVVPDRTFIFDISVDTASARLRESGKAPDRLEGNGRAFHERVRQGYLTLAARDPGRVVVIDGEREAGRIGEEVWARVRELADGLPRNEHRQN